MNRELRDLSEKIYHNKTKEYFEEVLSSYENKNFRSAIVMLYSVTICDLTFKLKDLSEIHNDSKARKILDDLNDLKEEEPVSPEWEYRLIDKAFKEAKILENDIYRHIITLKDYRNLSAHPVLNSLEVLYKPNEEQAISLIKNILEGLFTKHPLYTKNVFVPFLLEIERVKDEFPSKKRLEAYLESKFFNHFSDDLVKYIFKSLWNFVFVKEGEREDLNRDINYKVLLIIYDKYEEVLFQEIQKEDSHYSTFTDTNTNIVNKYIDFLSRKVNVYPLIKAHSKQILQNKISANNSYFTKAIFLSESIKEHLLILRKEFHYIDYTFREEHQTKYEFTKNEISFLEKVSTDEAINEFYDLMIYQFVYSSSFDTAKFRFDRFILPYYTHFSSENMKLLLIEANGNYQCYGGRNAKNKYIHLLKIAEELLGDDIRDTYKNLY